MAGLCRSSYLWLLFKFFVLLVALSSCVQAQIVYPEQEIQGS